MQAVCTGTRTVRRFAKNSSITSFGSSLPLSLLRRNNQAQLNISDSFPLATASFAFGRTVLHLAGFPFVPSVRSFVHGAIEKAPVRPHPGQRERKPNNFGSFRTNLTLHFTLPRPPPAVQRGCGKLNLPTVRSKKT